jgi:anti-sigma28 factor (negative regulator of flagellin synthesis)
MKYMYIVKRNYYMITRIDRDKIGDIFPIEPSKTINTKAANAANLDDNPIKITNHLQQYVQKIIAGDGIAEEKLVQLQQKIVNDEYEIKFDQLAKHLLVELT